MSFVTTGDGVEIFYKDWGAGRPVMFHHGRPLSSDAWDAQLLFLVRRGHRVIAHDRRGHGRSAQVGHGHDMDHYAADAAAVVAHPGQTATEFTGHVGQGVEEGAEAAVRIAVLGPDTPTGTVTDRAGVLPW